MTRASVSHRPLPVLLLLTIRFIPICPLMRSTWLKKPLLRAENGLNFFNPFLFS